MWKLRRSMETSADGGFGEGFPMRVAA